ADRRRKPGGEDVERDVTVAAKAESRQSVGRHRPEKHGERAARQSHDHAVEEIVIDATAAEHEQRVAIALQGGCEDPCRRPRKGVLVGLQRSRDHHIQRKKAEPDEEASRQVEHEFAAAEGLLGPVMSSIRSDRHSHVASLYCSRRTKIWATMVTTMI